MKIRKKFNVESAHIVRNCTSERCSHSIHGHSAIIELFFEADTLDNAQMVYDFGLLKTTVKSFIDSMDHCYILCSKDNNDFRNFIKKSCDRWIEIPFNPSAEMLSVYIMAGVNKILSNTVMNNGESQVRICNVRYSETATGYAECDKYDLSEFNKKYNLDDIVYSDMVKNEWDKDLTKILLNNENVSNPIIEQQIKLD